MTQAARPRSVVLFVDSTGKEPFSEWLEALRDHQARRRILTRLRRVEQGNFGDCKALQDGIHELRFTFGPGYRVYFGEDGDTIVVLLCGGDKSSQERDIERAKAFWQEYQSNARIPHS